MSNFRHGKRRSRIYGIWCAMLSHCRNPNDAAYHYYGGRGISVCDRWAEFENFYSDMGDRPEGKSLDRVDNNMGYSPENCEWRDRKAQSRNRRNIKLLEVDGVPRPISEWSELTGIGVGTLWNRKKLGWSDEAAVTTPVMRGPRKGVGAGFQHEN